jgi:hypothetical protein
MIFNQLRGTTMATSIRHIPYASGATGNNVALVSGTRKDLTLPDLGGAPTFFLNVYNPTGSGAVVSVVGNAAAQTGSGTVVLAGSSTQLGPFRVADCPALIADANVTVRVSIVAVISEG